LTYFLRQRLDRLHVFEVSGGAPFANGGGPGDQSRADALSLFAASLANLISLIERTESAVELLVMAEGSDQEDVDVRVVRLLEWNEEREWLADKLRAAEGAVCDGKVQPERVLGLREAIRKIVKADEVCLRPSFRSLVDHC
jgi:pantothenate kinase